MTDFFSVVETTALAHVACAPQESGILLTDFAAAYPSVNHSRIFLVLQGTELLEFIFRFLRTIYYHSTTRVEFVRVTRGQLLMARRETRPSCERLLACSGARSHLPLARRHFHSKKPSRTGLSSAQPAEILFASSAAW